MVSHRCLERFRRQDEQGSVLLAVLVVIALAALIGTEILYGVVRESHFSRQKYRQTSLEIGDRLQFIQQLEELQSIDPKRLLERSIEISHCNFEEGRREILTKFGEIGVKNKVGLFRLPSYCTQADSTAHLLEVWWGKEGRRYRAKISIERSHDSPVLAQKLPFVVTLIENDGLPAQIELLLEESGERYYLPASAFTVSELSAGRLREFDFQDDIEQPRRLLITGQGKVLFLTAEGGIEVWQDTLRISAFFERQGLRFLDWREAYHNELWQHLLLLEGDQGIEWILFTLDPVRHQMFFDEIMLDLRSFEPQELPHLQLYKGEWSANQEASKYAFRLVLANVPGLERVERERIERLPGGYRLALEDGEGLLLFGRNFMPKYYGAFLILVDEEKELWWKGCPRGLVEYRSQGVVLGCQKAQTGKIERIQ